MRDQHKNTPEPPNPDLIPEDQVLIDDPWDDPELREFLWDAWWNRPEIG